MAFFFGNLSRRTLLGYIFPAAFVSYFGSLALAICLLPGSHDWKSATISKLALYPQNNPKFGWIGSAGIALAGALIIPFAGYIGHRLRCLAPWGSGTGAALFRIGAGGAVLCGVIAYHGNSRFPALHTWLARVSAFSLGAAMIVFWACVLREYFSPADGKRRSESVLLAVWSILVFAGPAAAILSTLETANRLRELAGLYEWAASAVFFLFLLASVLLIPE